MAWHRRNPAAAVIAALAVTISGCAGRPAAHPAPTSVPSTATSATAPPTTTSQPAAPTTGPPTTGPPSVTSTTGATAARPTVPTPRAAQVVTRGPFSGRAIALTFDAGSDAGNTTRILDVLAADHIRATFGVTGRWAEANPALLRRIAAEGHQVVNHTYDHQSFTGASTETAALTRGQRVDELARAETAIRTATGAGADGWFRPPYGDRDATVDADAGAAGYRYELMWTVDSLGWKGLAATSVAERCLAAAAPGAIILMHVGTASTDADALPQVIAGLAADGYAFVTAAELVAGPHE